MAQQIESKDIKLYASEKLNDAADGGGRVTTNEIESGQVNNVFQDISRVDHANGSVELRKLFMGIRTNNSAPLLGAHMLIVNPPQDDNVTALIFQTPKDHRETDTRTTARDYLENYFIKSSREFVQPLGLNIEMANTLTLIAALTIPVNIRAGDTIVLFDSVSGREEYVKIAALSVTTQNFVYRHSNGNYETFRAQLVRCQLVAPLSSTWDGGEAMPNGTTNNNLSVFSTVITNAARYRGVTKLAAELADGETIARAENVLQPLVPVARQEQALTNRSPYTDIAPIIRGTDADETPLELIVTPAEDSGVLYMPTAVTRASMTITAASASWSENGSGELVQSGALTAELSIDYRTGILSYSGVRGIALTIRYLPAASVNAPAVTTGVEVTQANLGLIYTFDLSDLKPEPSTIYIEYMSANDWLTMTDNGQGMITGQGVGSIDYVSGQVQVTLEHEPEVGSYILLSYMPARENMFDRPSGVNQAENIEYIRELAFNGPIKPNTLTIEDLAETKTSADNGAGEFSGTAGSGTVEYAHGKISLSPAATAHETTYRVTAETANTGVHNASVSVSVSGNVNVSGNLGRVAIPGTVKLTVIVVSRVATKTYAMFTQKTDLANGSWGHTVHDDGTGKLISRGDEVGTINYATGEFALPDFLKTETYEQISQVDGKPTKVETTKYQIVNNNQVAASFIYDVGDYIAQTKEITIANAQIRISDIRKYQPIIPKSLWFVVDGVNYFDDGNGKVVTNYSTITGAGEQVGNIDYQNGLLDIRNVSVTAQSVDVKSLTVLTHGMASDQLLFAIKDRPLRHASFQMNVETIDGTVRRYAADESGIIKVVGAETAVGKIDVQTGVVIIDASTISGDVEARASVLGSLRYNAVKSESLPVDPDIVGLNVQRLPIDGRVPIFKLGDTVVLNHWAQQDIDTPTAGQTVQIDRDHLAEVQVLCDGAELDADQYEVDLETGALTFSDPLVLQDAEQNALTGDWAIKHRIEHMTLATRVQMNGNITLQVASAHTFPVGTTISSALLFGDLQADVGTIFTQRTWQNNNPNWSDSPDSSGETTARYDTINYPIEASNYSSVTDKWALVFRSSSTVDVVSENLGVIVTGVAIGNTIAPINPITDEPYFVITPDGWGGGWATGNALRFNTISALAPFWIARTVTPAQGITESDSFTLSPRGDSQ